MNMDIELKRQYELNYILSPELSAENLLNLQKKIEDYIKDLGGEIREINPPRRESLAFPIAKKERGFRGEIIFGMLITKLADFEKKLKIEKDFLRYAIFRYAPPVLSPRRTRKPRIKKAICPEILQKPTAKTPPLAKKEGKIKLEEIDKKLEEILGM